MLQASQSGNRKAVRAIWPVAASRNKRFVTVCARTNAENQRGSRLTKAAFTVALTHGVKKRLANLPILVTFVNMTNIGKNANIGCKCQCQLCWLWLWTHSVKIHKLTRFILLWKRGKLPAFPTCFLSSILGPFCLCFISAIYFFSFSIL